jgi:hypothetical protein
VGHLKPGLLGIKAVAGELELPDTSVENET